GALDAAAGLDTPTARYPTAHLAELPPAPAVLAARGEHETGGRRRDRIRSAWEVLPDVAPELSEWSDLFASGAARRARAEAGIPGAADDHDADGLLRDAAAFLRLAERLLSLRPVLPQPRTDDPGERPDAG
ncbi:SAV_6107 family HEPN domain-containing protein, partial [Streptomyces sp. NPDC006296]|uniref:SAV_6107 family HEPN domain-containing protein n=1 Tax=Streptomyces sp. NPDC006296 TaxID=3156746 RepID=UPI0033A79F2E